MTTEPGAGKLDTVGVTGDDEQPGRAFS